MAFTTSIIAFKRVTHTHKNIFRKRNICRDWKMNSSHLMPDKQRYFVHSSQTKRASFKYNGRAASSAPLNLRKLKRIHNSLHINTWDSSKIKSGRLFLLEQNYHNELCVCNVFTEINLCYSYIYYSSIFQLVTLQK
jgi:hypothetical protein